MVKKWGVLLLGALAGATVLIAGANAVAVPVSPLKVDLSSRAAVTKYLASHGIDSKTFVIQRGARNYAGKHCPGKGWNCTTAKRVVQISYVANVSTFTCTPSSGGSATSPNDCLIVQFSGTTSNNATCTEKTTGADVTQSCRILQSTTTGSNLANLQQQIDATTGAIQTGNQYAGVEQDTTNGTNSTTISQVLNQTTTTTAAGVQDQNGYQTTSVLQNTTLGTNSATVTQAQTLKATASNLPFVSQSQNTDATEPNTQASIRQNNGATLNTANLNQSHNLDATLNRVTTGTQTQGTSSGGLLGHFEQSSTGLSLVKGVQNELQQLHATGVPNLTQTQWGPAWFGSDQGSNPADHYDISQTSTQNASSPLAVQDDQVYANCDTTGICTSKTTITQDGVTHTNNCTGPSCHIGQTSTAEGSGTETSTCSGEGSEGGCPSPPYPPPPPFESD